MIHARHPEVAERLYQQLQGNRVATPSVAAVQEAQRHLAEKGYQCPEWDLVWNGARGASDLVILNAADLSEVAVLELPLAIPHGLHGSWSESV